MAWTPRFGTSGIRGSIPDELTLEIAWRAGISIATALKQQPLLLCHDNRTSGQLLAQAVASGLMAGGSRVLLGGEVITPAVSFYTRHRLLAGAVLITGSHIPAHMSGIEVLDSDGAPVNRVLEKKIEDLIELPGSPLPWNQMATMEYLDDVGEFWVSRVLDQVDAEIIRERKFRVVVDAANGTAIPWLYDLLNNLDCTTIAVNARSDPTFPGRSPNLRVKLLEKTAAIVRETQSDLGVAVDGDGDRAFFIDDKGRALMGDISGTLLACIELDRHNGGTIVTPINSSNLIEDMASKHKGNIEYSRVGPPAIVAAVKKYNAIFAFEESGKAIYPHLNYLSDSGLATTHLLEHLVKQKTRFSSIIDSFPKYFQLKRALDCPNPMKQKIINHTLELVKKEAPNAKVVTIDGVKVIFEDGWLLLRPSGTEPVFRCFAEARKESRAKDLLELGLDWIDDILHFKQKEKGGKVKTR